ncbi:MAG: hypothetical protein CMH57_07890 [Myxococcales bacterium]|nr:hypothetical protein [Myxococcales bacterium]
MSKMTLWVHVMAVVAVVVGVGGEAAAQSIVGRVGFPVGGGGEVETRAGGSSADVDVDDGSGMSLEALILKGAGRGARLGAFIQYTDNREFEPEQGGELRTGSSLALDGVVEFDLAKTSGVSFHAAGLGGLMVYFPDDDLEEMQEQADDEGVKFGFNLGGGLGLAVPLSGKLALRGDFYAMYEQATLIDGEQLEYALTNTRYMLAVGFMLR